MNQLLDEVLTVCEGFSDKKHSCGLEHCEFQVVTERSVLLFRAMTREERDAWVGHLRPTRQGYLLHVWLAVVEHSASSPASHLQQEVRRG